MRPVAAALLLVFSASPAAAFLAQPRWKGSDVEFRGGHAALPVGTRLPTHAGEPTEQQPAVAGGFVAGAALFAAALLIGGVRRSRTTTYAIGGFKIKLPAGPGMKRDVGVFESPAYQEHLNLKRYARKSNVYGTRRLRFKNHMRMSKITRFTEQWVYWYPDQHKFNMYYGPESHSENPDFPAPSGGTPEGDGPYAAAYAAAKAVSGWAPAQLSASVGRQGKSGGFAGGSARTAGSAKRAVSGARSAVAMRAHKMAASSTKNQGGGTTIPKWRGVQRLAFQGSFVKAGTLLVRQTGVKWATAGGGVKMCRNYNIIALKDGIVQWRGSPGSKNEGGKGEVTVVPWEYVRAKCEWANDSSNESTLVYKEYKPWMGTHMHDRTATFNGAKTGLRRKIMAEKRKIWEESPEGQEHLKKKQEKREKQKAINAKWRAYRKAKKEEKAKEAVDK